MKLLVPSGCFLICKTEALLFQLSSMYFVPVIVLGNGDSGQIKKDPV